MSSRCSALIVFFLTCLVASPCVSRAGPLPVTSGLVLRLESDAGVTTDGSNNVSAWADQSGQGHNGIPPTASNQPTLIAGALNGLPGLSFNGSSDYLVLEGQVLNSQTFSIFAVVSDLGELNQGSNRFREVFSNWTFENQQTSVFLGTVNKVINDQTSSSIGVRFTDNYSNGNQGVGTLVDPSTPFVLTAINGSSNGTNATVYQDSTILGDKGSMLTTRVLSIPYVIGRQAGTNNEYWHGLMGAVLVYDRALNSSETQEVQTYLSEKYIAVPEPGGMALMALACLGGLGLLRGQRPGMPGRSKRLRS